MIASLVLTGKYNVGISESGKVKIDGNTLSLKDIPFIRYRFDHYGEEEIKFINENMTKFVGPVHLAEVTICDNVIDILEKMNTKLAKFVYIPLDDEIVATSKLPDNVTSVLEEFDDDTPCDRIMIKDNTSMMYPLLANRYKLLIEDATGCTFESKDIGVCGSTLSFRSDDTPGQACLTAVWARRIMAAYADNDDIVVPTASHECMNCCGCIQYLVVNEDIPAPSSAKKKSAETKAKSNNSGEPKPKKEKKATGASVWIDL